MQASSREKAELLFDEGCNHLARADFASAQTCWLAALQLEPHFAEALTNLAFVQEHLGDKAAAEATYRRALEAGADSYELYMNLGVLLAAQTRFAEAEEAYAQALFRCTESSAVWSNLGALYLAMKNDLDAQACLQKALLLEPANAKAQFNLSHLYLRQGRFDEGWPLFEARDWYAGLAKHFACPRWSGESLRGCSVVIGYEAGHGDVIQFSRYVPMVKALGASHITLVCHPALKDLLQTLDGISTVKGFDEEIATNGWDYWTPLMSLPYHFKTRADSVPASIPYLQADAGLVERWAKRLPADTVRVGLVWKGNPKFENDAQRSLPGIRTLEPLWRVDGVSWVSLQKGAGEDELKDGCETFPVLDLGSKVDNFADVAAIVVSLDLVICVDTAVAHLAGALGKPCWVLLPDVMTDWRWRSEGAASAWYPDVMRLFRQGSDGLWPPVVEEVAQTLATFVQFREGQIVRIPS